MQRVRDRRDVRQLQGGAQHHSEEARGPLPHSDRQHEPGFRRRPLQDMREGSSLRSLGVTLTVIIFCGMIVGVAVLLFGYLGEITSEDNIRIAMSTEHWKTAFCGHSWTQCG